MIKNNIFLNKRKTDEQKINIRFFNKKRRTHFGQIWSLDFAISAVAFFVVVILLIFTWNYINLQNIEQREFNEMQTKVLRISDSLIRNTGVPSNWNNNTVMVIGLADYCPATDSLGPYDICGNILNKTKVSGFIAIDYNYARELLGIGPYEYYFKLKDLDDRAIKLGGILTNPPIAYFASHGSYEMVELMNKSEVIWDFYWGSGQNVSQNNARYVYSGNEVDLFKMIIANISNYNTIVVENPDVNYTQLTNGERQALNNSVKNGLLYLQIRGVDTPKSDHLFRIFGFEDSDFSNNDTQYGNLTDISDPILSPDVNLYDLYEFEQGIRTFVIAESPIDMLTIMEAQGNSSECLVCHWNHSNGDIYILPDIDNKTADAPFIGLNMFGINMEKGEYPTENASVVVPVERYVMYDDKIAKMVFILWRE